MCFREGPLVAADPHRRCVGCGRSRPKRELVRFVRGPGGLEPDPEGRRPGRGAYLCRRSDCGRRALTRKGFERALRAPVRVADDTLIFIEELNGEEARP